MQLMRPLQLQNSALLLREGVNGSLCLLAAPLFLS